MGRSAAYMQRFPFVRRAITKELLRLCQGLCRWSPIGEVHSVFFTLLRLVFGGLDRRLRYCELMYYHTVLWLCWKCEAGYLCLHLTSTKCTNLVSQLSSFKCRVFWCRLVRSWYPGSWLRDAAMQQYAQGFWTWTIVRLLLIWACKVQLNVAYSVTLMICAKA